MAIDKDIGSRDDIEHFLRAFYERVKSDPVIGMIFTDVAKIDWEHHIPVITDFWETILLDNPVYKKNAMEVHYALNRKYPLTKEHFDTWLTLFITTLDSMFCGEKAALATQRARSIAGMMQHKIAQQ